MTTSAYKRQDFYNIIVISNNLGFNKPLKPSSIRSTYTMKQSIEATTKQFVQQLFEAELSKDLLYHDLEHTLTVAKHCRVFGEQLQLTPKEMEVLQLAALLHDTGYTKVYQGHEEASIQIAKVHLEKQQYPADRIQQISELIEATIPQQEPRNLLEQIIKDADLSNIGSKGFMEIGQKLRSEWAHFLDEHYDDLAWQQTSVEFLNNHQFYTDVAQQRFGAQKKENLKTIKKSLKKMSTNVSSGTINSSKSAQMMFKTSLRNHIDLTNIADNKANMMLSINAIVISITMPLLASNINDQNMYLLIPGGILLTTCMLSIIFATLATRPIKMNGLTNFNQIPSGNTNLFFFGNFYNLPISDYREGIKEVMKEDELLESTIVNDLFYLGKALGNKYNRLRVCYGIFMTGITLTVIAFAISFVTSMNA